jgi:hypothetical protein
MTIFAPRRKTAATLVKPGLLCWFVDPSTTPPTSVGYIRDHRGGAFVIGGRTGSHYTGHAESWWDKLVLFASAGYVPADVAIRTEILPKDWAPPQVSDKDAELVRRIELKEI